MKFPVYTTRCSPNKSTIVVLAPTTATLFFILWLRLSLLLLGTSVGSAGAAAAEQGAHRGRRLQQLPEPTADSFAAVLLGGNLASCDADRSSVASGLLVDELFAGNAAADGGTYRSVCRCADTSNAADLELAQRQAEATLNFTIFTEALGNLRLRSEWKCQNECATCFPPDGTACGVFSGTNVTTIQGLPTNHTLPFEGSLDTELCFEYTAGDHTGDTVCWGASLDIFAIAAGDGQAEEVPPPPSELSCFLRYNGEECNSCRMVVSPDVPHDTCLQADCSNLGEPEMVDTCADDDDPTTAEKFLPLFYFGGGGFEDPAQLTADCSVATRTSAAATCTTTAVLIASASCGLLVFLVGLL